MLELYRKETPDGLVCANDLTAVTVMNLLLNSCVRVPKDPKLAGVDDLKLASMMQVSLTTIHQPCYDLGEAAIRVMFERLLNPEVRAREIMLDAPLIIRTSSSRGG